MNLESELLDRLALGALVVDAQARVLYCNAAARLLADAGDAIRIGAAGLGFLSLAQEAAFAVALRKAIRPPPRSSLVPLPCRHGIREVSVSPLEPGGQGPAAQPLALVVIAPALPDERSIAQRARRLYRLTEAEARVMSALAAGATVDEVARQHRVHVSTVRAQLRSVFEKTGVNRQTDLVRLALAGAPLAAGPEF